MNKEICKCVSTLVESVNSDNFLDIAEGQIEKLISLDRNGETIELLLRLIESNPRVDFGMPGPIVHFLEKFYKSGYEEKLLQSIERRPVPHNVWMLNRVVNGAHGDKKIEYINRMKSVLRSNSVSEETRDLVSAFLR